MIDKTINYRYKKKLFSVNVTTPYTDKLAICINGVLCNYVSIENFILNIDSILHRSIDRYVAERTLTLIP
jgi:hypothetical protein